MRFNSLSYMFLCAIAAMEIAVEYGNIPSWVVDWPHCCDIEGDSCEDVRRSGMLLETQNRRKMIHFIAACGRAILHTCDDLFQRCCNKALPFVVIKWAAFLRF